MAFNMTTGGSGMIRVFIWELFEFIYQSDVEYIQIQINTNKSQLILYIYP